MMRQTETAHTAGFEPASRSEFTATLHRPQRAESCHLHHMCAEQELEESNLWLRVWNPPCSPYTKLPRRNQ